MFPKRNLEAIRLDEMSSGEGQTVTESLKSESQGSSTTYDASATSSNGDFLHHSKPANHAETDDLGPGTNPSSLNQQLLLLHSLLGGGGMALAQNAQRVSQQALISQINQATSSLAALKGTNMQMTNKKNGCLSQEIQQPSTTEPTTPHIGNQPGGDHSEEGPGRTDIVVQPLLGLDETGSVFESKMPPGAIMAPCRARGMPQDHNCKVSNIIV